MNGDVLTEPVGIETQVPSETLSEEEIEQMMTATYTEPTAIVKPSIESSTKYAYQSLDDDEKALYDAIVGAASSMRFKIRNTENVSIEKWSKVFGMVYNQEPQLFWLNTKAKVGKIYFNESDTAKIESMQAEIDKTVDKLISEASGKSTYDQLKIFHDYLVLNVESATDDPTADSIYGALVNKKALCEGYAKAFSYLCNLAGIENMIVTGYTDVDHMWNMVKLEGKWYHIDVGWDKPSAALSERYPDMVLYQYFLSEDSVMENNRIISNMLCDPPVADSSDMYYFNVENKYAETYDQALEIIEQSCRRCIDSGEKYFMIKLDSSNLYLQTTSDLIKPDSEGVTDIDRIVRSLNFKGQISYIDYYKAYRIIIFVLE